MFCLRGAQLHLNPTWDGCGLDLALSPPQQQMPNTGMGHLSFLKYNCVIQTEYAFVLSFCLCPFLTPSVSSCHHLPPYIHDRHRISSATDPLSPSLLPAKTPLVGIIMEKSFPSINNSSSKRLSRNLPSSTPSLQPIEIGDARGKAEKAEVIRLPAPGRALPVPIVLCHRHAFSQRCNREKSASSAIASGVKVCLLRISAKPLSDTVTHRTTRRRGKGRTSVRSWVGMFHVDLFPPDGRDGSALGRDIPSVRSVRAAAVSSGLGRICRLR
ncbi:hypothetical protein B0T21DRAFT_131870 [Apiosordaria backusii]|uniref:Uncharacterized protein n=1 Tax=Apiosordaria backusii TaxID=314023 RepID=A0AA40ENC7_9PEZI|nr:hypothetical protein B0T21DRAFT_131870 [Apiosordaria backusii]